VAREVVVKVVVDASQVDRGFQRASHTTKKFEKYMSHLTRGVLSGSGAFQHLGRSLAFASGGFVAIRNDRVRKGSIGRPRSSRQPTQPCGADGVGNRSVNKERIDKVALSYTSSASERRSHRVADRARARHRQNQPGAQAARLDGRRRQAKNIRLANAAP
jgi:hypothetical protein